MRRLALILLVFFCGCGSGGGSGPEPLPRKTPIGLAMKPKTTYISKDGVHFVPGTPMKHTGRWDLIPLGWTAVRFSGGQLTLSGLGQLFEPQIKACAVDHVEVGPLRDGFRRVTVLAEPNYGQCQPGPDEVRLMPPGWTRQTVATPSGLDVPDPRLTGEPLLAGYGHAVLQPDRRTIIVLYQVGGCHDLARVTATLKGKTATVTVIDGTQPHYPDHTACTANLAYGQTYVRLPVAAPPGTTIVVATCPPAANRRCI